MSISPPERKPVKNKLDPFRERIRELAAESKKLADIVAELKADGCVTSLSSVAEYLSRMRKAESETQMFELIATGGQMNKELEAAFKANPAPEIDQLMRLSKSLIMSLQVHGAAEPDLLRLSNSMQKTLLTYLSGKTKADIELRKLALDERRLVILEAKAKQAEAAEKVANADLSSEETAARIREIFKRS